MRKIVEKFSIKNKKMQNKNIAMFISDKNNTAYLNTRCTKSKGKVYVTNLCLDTF